jgi:hypothetical protein
MSIKSRIAAGAIATLALAGSGIGATAAASASTHPQAVVSQEPTGPDTDTIQQGNQTSPDATMAAATGGENASENSSENAPSDGPGGHADTSGNVQHEFSGVE